MYCFFINQDMTLAVHFEAPQMWEQLKEFFAASSLDADASIHIKRCNCTCAELRQGLQALISHTHNSKQAQKFKRSATFCKGDDPLIRDTHTPVKIRGSVMQHVALKQHRGLDYEERST